MWKGSPLLKTKKASPTRLSPSARFEPRVPLESTVHVPARSGATLDPCLPRTDQRVRSRIIRSAPFAGLTLPMWEGVRWGWAVGGG
jgi:hypothetical protein